MLLTAGWNSIYGAYMANVWSPLERYDSKSAAGRSSLSYSIGYVYALMSLIKGLLDYIEITKLKQWRQLN